MLQSKNTSAWLGFHQAKNKNGYYCGVNNTNTDNDFYVFLLELGQSYIWPDASEVTMWGILKIKWYQILAFTVYILCI